MTTTSAAVDDMVDVDRRALVAHRLQYLERPSTKETAMRKLIGMILAIGTIAAATPLQAQTYDPNYPVCLQVYGRAGNYISCGYTTIGQCQASASGRAAQCITNPYYAGAVRRKHRAYY